MALLKTLNKGAIINFSGREYILLDPVTGFIRSKGSVISRMFVVGANGEAQMTTSLTDEKNMWYYLNTTFFNTIPTKLQQLILSKSWGVNGLPGTGAGISETAPTMTLAQMKTAENSNMVMAKIGLLSVSEWREHAIYYNPTSGVLEVSIPGAWLRTPEISSPYPYYAFIAGKTPDTSSGSINQIDAGKVGYYTLPVFPAMYLDPEVNVVNGIVTPNSAPTLNITAPTNNQTLYENDTLNITGTAHDADPDQSVTAYYQINNEQRKVLATNLSQTQIGLSKQFTFKAGKLYDGETAITGDLADGVAHALKVWAVDSEGASSVVAERTFYVVPNRAPLLSVDAVVPSGVVDTDKFTISGNASDQDANANVTVTQRINGGNAIEIYNGPGGAWEFDVSLAQLSVGQNTIIIEVIDNYGAKSSKTIKLNKNEVKTPILHSVARYKIEPPKGSAKGVLLWIQRDEDLADLKVELSMTLQGEQESYTTLTATNTAPVDSVTVEDEFYFEENEAKNNIILKLSTSREDINIDHKIHLISGVLE